MITPVSAAAARSECHQLLSFPTLLESRRDNLSGPVRGHLDHVPYDNLFCISCAPHPARSKPGGHLGTTGQFSYAINVSIAS